jgi:hypothetical protein
MVSGEMQAVRMVSGVEFVFDGGPRKQELSTSVIEKLQSIYRRTSLTNNSTWQSISPSKENTQQQSPVFISASNTGCLPRAQRHGHHLQDSDEF